MKMFPIVVALLLSLVPALALADLDAVKDLGVRMNDWTFDNGAVLNAAIHSNRVNDAIDFPGGVVHFNTTIDLGHKVGLAFVGNGTTHWLNEGAYTARRSGNAATRFVYTGPPDKPAIIYRGVGLRWEGIVLQRGRRDDFDQRGPQGIGLQIARYQIGNPAGKIWMPQAAFFGWDVAIDLAGGAPHHHSDNSAVGWVRFYNCGTCFRSQNHQAVDWDFQWLGAVSCNTVFDVWNGGGKWSVSTLSLATPALVFHLRKTRTNACLYKIGNLSVDAHCAGWRLCQMDQPGPVCLIVRGIVANAAAPGENFIDIPTLVKKNLPDGYQTVDVELYNAPWASAWNGKSEKR